MNDDNRASRANTTLEISTRSNQQSGMIAVLRNGPFLLLWIAQLLSQTANNMVNFALLIRVQDIVTHHQIEQANIATSLVILAFSLPAILFGPVAGVFADRFNKRYVLFFTNLLRAVAMILFLIIRPGWQVDLILLATYLVTFVFGIAGQFFAPAQGAMIPVLVPRQNLVSANALFNLTFTASQLLGFAVLGPLAVKLFGVDTVFALSLGVFLVCSALVVLLPSAPAARRSDAVSEHAMARLWSDIREGLRFISQDPALMRAIANLTIAATTFLMVAALGPEFITTVIGLPTDDIVYVVLPAGLGVLAGVFLVNIALRYFPRDVLIDASLTCAGLALLGIALVGPVFDFFWINGNASNALVVGFVALLATVLGLCNAFVLVPSQTVLQERSLEHIRARVFATFYTISNTCSFVPIFFAAAMADLFGVAQVLALVAVIVITYGAASLLHRTTAEEARWQATRTRHREGPETLSFINGEKNR